MTYQGLSGNNGIEHQVIIAKLITGINNHFDKIKKYKSLIATPESKVGNENGYKIPDIIIWDSKSKSNADSPLVIIEVCFLSMKESEVEKCTALMQQFSSIKESVVIVIDPEISFLVVRRKKNNEPTKPKKISKLETIKLDLSKFIEV